MSTTIGGIDFATIKRFHDQLKDENEARVFKQTIAYSFYKSAKKVEAIQTALYSMATIEEFEKFWNSMYAFSSPTTPTFTPVVKSELFDNELDKVLNVVSEGHTGVRVNPSGMTRREQFDLYTITRLRDMCRRSGIKGQSKYSRKPELINFMVVHQI